MDKIHEQETKGGSIDEKQESKMKNTWKLQKLKEGNHRNAIWEEIKNVKDKQVWKQ